MVYTEIDEFEWDSEKNVTNFKKHGLKFEQAIEVFFDIYSLIMKDVSHSTNESRYQIVGATKFGLLFVVFTERNKQNLRIISARKCHKKERLKYERQNR